jgi:hypothetical protein
LRDEVEALLRWFAATYPEHDRPTRKTIKNNISDRHREIVRKAQN